MDRSAPSPAILRQKLNSERCEPGTQLLLCAITAMAIVIGMKP